MIRYLSLLLLICAVGCGGPSGPPLAPVSGQVTFFGKPHTKGIVVFTPVDGGPGAMSTTDADGKYELWTAGKKGAVMGAHKVSVSTKFEVEAPVQLNDLKSDDPRYEEMMRNPDPYKAAAKPKDPIPAKYNTNTELKFDVNSGNNTIDIVLK